MRVKEESVNVASIDREFEALIRCRNVGKRIGLSKYMVYRLRKNPNEYKTFKKMEMLVKAGWRWDGVWATDAHLIEFARWYNTKLCGSTARELGYEYALEKWKKSGMR